MFEYEDYLYAWSKPKQNKTHPPHKLKCEDEGASKVSEKIILNL